jgi:phage shock protein PspC (stress-responsive transcriptional regulator)
VLGGVSDATAQYLGISRTVARVIFVAAALVGGLGLVLYSVLWLFVPDDHERVLIQGDAASSGESAAAALLAGVAALTASAWITRDGPSWLAAIMVTVGVVVMSRRAPSDPAAAPPMPPPPPPSTPSPFPSPSMPMPPAAPPPPAPMTPPTPDGEATDVPPVQSDPTTSVAADTIPTGVLPLVAERQPMYPRAAPGPRSAPRLDPPPPRPPRPAAFLGPLTVSVAVALAGSLSILNALGAVDLRTSDLLIAVLVVVGLGLLVSTWYGRARGLILLGVLLVPAVAVSAVADRIDLRGGTGERVWVPRTPAELQDRYRLGAGSLQLDLTELDVSTIDPGDPTLRTELSMGTGQVQLVVPQDWTLEVSSTVDIGTVWLFSGGSPAPEDGAVDELGSGEIRWDLDGAQDWYFPERMKVPNDADDDERRTIRVAGAEGAPALDVDVSVTAGVVEVFRVAS